MKVCGIDPGRYGAIAFVDDGKLERVYKMPVSEDGFIIGSELYQILKVECPDKIIIEHSQPVSGKVSAQSTFAFGRNFGQILSIVQLSKLPYELVKPRVWQARVHGGISPKLKPKDKSYIAYNRLFPERPMIKSEDGIIDASLIAYAYRE